MLRTVCRKNLGTFGFSGIFHSLLPPGVKDLDFISCVMWPSQQILWRELVAGEPNFLFTLHFLCIKTFSPVWRTSIRTLGFLSLQLFAFAHLGSICLEMPGAAGICCSPLWGRDHSLLLPWDPPVYVVLVPSPPAVPVKGFFIPP